MTPAGEPPPLGDTLDRARTLGFLGPGPIDAHLQHAEGFGTVVEHVLGHVPSSLADLGSGGGVPGLVLAARWPACATTLVESNHRRAAHLRTAAAELGWSGRVEVIEDRAELVARRAECRERFEVVTARSFATPAATAEIAAGLVRLGGVLVVSDPPEPDPQRWPAEKLARTRLWRSRAPRCERRPLRRAAKGAPSP